MEKKRDSFVIDRRFWDRGRGKPGIKEQKVELIGPKGMCCLGFYGVHLGIDPFILLYFGEPAECMNEQNEFRNEFEEDVFGGILDYDEREGNFYHSDIAEVLIEVNDDNTCALEETREARVVEHFAKLNVDVSFIN